MVARELGVGQQGRLAGLSRGEGRCSDWPVPEPQHGLRMEAWFPPPALHLGKPRPTGFRDLA